MKTFRQLIEMLKTPEEMLSSGLRKIGANSEKDLAGDSNYAKRIKHPVFNDIYSRKVNMGHSHDDAMALAHAETEQHFNTHISGMQKIRDAAKLRGDRLSRIATVAADTTNTPEIKRRKAERIMNRAELSDRFSTGGIHPDLDRDKRKQAGERVGLQNREGNTRYAARVKNPYNY